MDDFIHKNKVVEFASEAGEVLDTNKYSKTEVTGKGGGSVGQGYNTDVKITSTTKTINELWYKTDDDIEKHIKLYDSPVAVRPGQKISMISTSIKGKDGSKEVVLVNHSAKKHWIININFILANIFKINSNNFLFYLFLNVAIAFGIALFVMKSHIIDVGRGDIISYAIVSGIIYGAIWVTKIIIKVNMLRTKLNTHLEKLASELQSN